MYEHLAEADIDAKGELVEKSLEEGGKFIPLIEFSTPLTDCLTRCNKNSLGLAAEAMLGERLALVTAAERRNPAGDGWQRLLVVGSGGWAQSSSCSW